MVEEIRILHVDDEPDFADIVATFLSQENDKIVVEHALTAGDALELMNDRQFDGVISDYDMPDISGIEYLKTVRAKDEHLPFIFFTGKGSEEIASQAISAGVTEYLQKGTGTSQFAVLANRITNSVEHYRARKAFDASQEQLSLFIEKSPLGVVEWDENFHFRHINEMAETILGYTEAELVGKPWETVVEESDLKPVTETVLSLMEDAGGYYRVNKNVRKDGEVITCEWHNRVVTNDDGSVTAIFSQFRDVTDRVERTREIEQQHQQFQYVEDIAVIGYWEIDTTTPEPHHVTLSNGVYALHELSTEEPFDVEMGYDYYHPDDRQIVVDAVERALSEGESFAFDARLITATGRERVVHSEGEPIIEDGEIVKVRGVIQDISERKEYERRLQEQNESLEEFAHIVSHDLRNPLNVAMGRLEMVRETTDNENLQAIARAHQRMQVLIDDLLSLARDDDMVRTLEQVRLESLAEECWNTMAHEQASLTVNTDLLLQSDRPRLKQLLENLFRNAVVHGGEDVRITLGEVDNGFFVEDDGRGISAADRETVFEVGYTTSPEGTGYGLSIVKDVVEAHGWDIQIKTGSEGGARFEITGISSGE